jgi:tRNA (mo5U34)-methyltransferase
MQLTQLHKLLKDTPLEVWSDLLEQQVQNRLSVENFGKLEQWQQAVDGLPNLSAGKVELNADTVSVFSTQALNEQQQSELKQQLKQLMPWRKGPYHLHGVDIDTEWRSDFKWQRIQPHIQPLQGKTVLDVGCGNGYHSWRMRGMGAELVIGIDPSALFVMQFAAVKHFIGEQSVFVLPLGIEDMPDNLRAFDTVFSMGVFYHRRSPMDHLVQLRNCLKPGGELVLETLVIDGDDNQVLVPEDRYAQMRNVWFIPSAAAMLKWLARCGYRNIRLVDQTLTTIEEQRSTEWMTFHSLQNFLDAHDHTKTVEGYPAPLRATFIAEAP